MTNEQSSSNTEPVEPAERTKAFRSRLAQSSFRRIEGYIASDDKERVDRVRQELRVTSDVAVAGLVRLGLSAYESARHRGEATTLQASPSTWLGAPAAAGTAAGSRSAQAVSPTPPRAVSFEPVHPSANPVALFFKSRKETHRAQ